MTEWDERIDLTESVREICQRLGIDETYVNHITLVPGEAMVRLFCGRDGRCRGAKYLDENGEAATETLTFKVLT